jgi:hypothetical protein
MFRVRPSRINEMKAEISFFTSEKRHIVRTLLESCGID